MRPSHTAILTAALSLLTVSTADAQQFPNLARPNVFPTQFPQGFPPFPPLQGIQQPGFQPGFNQPINPGLALNRLRDQELARLVAQGIVANFGNVIHDLDVNASIRRCRLEIDIEVRNCRVPLPLLRQQVFAYLATIPLLQTFRVEVNIHG